MCLPSWVPINSIGSGHHSRSYIVEDDGFLVESPVTWYSSIEKWAMSPGYDRRFHMGFERMVDYPGAVFLGSGGYHHHIGANVWRSSRGARRDPRSRGLSSYAIRYDDRDTRMKAAERLAASGLAVDITEERVFGVDPWGIGFELGL